MKTKYSLDKKFLAKALTSLIVRVLGALSGLILSIAVSRAIGIEQAGIYFLVLSIVVFSSSISRFGLDNATVRFTSIFSNDRGSLKKIWKGALGITLGFSVLTSVILYLSANFVSYWFFSGTDFADVLKAMLPSIVGLSCLTIAAMCLQGLGYTLKSIIILNILVNSLTTLSVVLFELETSSSVALSYSISSLVVVLISLYMLSTCQKTIPNLNSSKDFTFNRVINSCFPLWIVSIMSMLTQWSGQFIAGTWVNPTELAQLAVSQRIANLVSFALMAVNMLVAPKFAYMYEKNEIIQIRNLATKSVRLMLFLSTPLVCFIMYFPEILLNLFGDGFSDGAILLQIIAVGQFVNVATGSVGFLLSMSGHERDLRNSMLIAGFISIILALVLVPLYGVLGASISMALSLAMQNLIAAYLVNLRLGFNTLKFWRSY